MKTNILFAALIAAMLGSLGLSLDSYSESQDVIDAQVAAQRQARFERAAQDVCGPQAAFADLGNGIVQCFTKRNSPTIKVNLK
jgi:hypothetical protein